MTKRFILHYNFPPFSVGETGRFGGQNRREIGHGALAERSIAAVIPEENRFPYAIRVISRSHGIERFHLDGLGLRRHPGPDGRRCADHDPVAGISVGLVTDEA